MTGSGGGSPHPTPSGGQGNRPLWSSLAGIPPESPRLSAKAMQTEEEASSPLHLETAIPLPPFTLRWFWKTQEMCTDRQTAPEGVLRTARLNRSQSPAEGAFHP